MSLLMLARKDLSRVWRRREVMSSFNIELNRSLSSEASQEEEEKVAYIVNRETRKKYKNAIKEQRRLWYEEEVERRASSSQGNEDERLRIAEEKKIRDEKKRQVALENMERQERMRKASDEIYRLNLRKSIAKAETKTAEKIERQQRLIQELENESKHWMTTDEQVDAKITDALWQEPGSTGLVTSESHALWRYVIDFERVKETPLHYNDDPTATLLPTQELYERGRVATVTERLLRTQAPTLNEFYELLEDANEISETIKDLKVVEQKKKPYVRRGGGGGRGNRGSASR